MNESPKSLDQMIAAPLKDEKLEQAADDVRQFIRIVE